MQAYGPIAPRALLAAFLTVLTPMSLAARQEEDDAPAQKKEPATAAQSQARPVAEYVFVEDSLPYVPRSNTIVTKLPLELRLTPNNVGTVSDVLAEEQLDRVLGDALVNVSNINVQSGSAVFDYFSIRGFDSLSSGLILTDGASEPETTFYQLYNVERIEVLKGPGGFLYGSNPLAGAVNLVRKQPFPANALQFRANAGSFETYEGVVDWNYGAVDRPVSFRLNGLFRDQGSHRDGKTGRTGAINPALTWSPGADSRLNLNFEYVYADFTPDTGIPVIFDTVAPVDDDTNYQSQLDTSKQDLYRFQADYETKINDWLTIRNKFYRRDLDWVSNGTIFSGVVPTGPSSSLLIRNLVLLDDRQAFTGNQFESVFAFRTGEVTHDLLTGFELARFADVFTLDVSFLSPVDVLDPVEPPGSAPVPIPEASSVGDARSIVAAPYVIDQVQFGEKLHVLVGGRLDSIDFEDQASDRKRTDTEFSPMLGVLVAPSQDVSIYGNFSRSFAPPSPRVTGELVPERSTQYEAGVKKRFEAIRTQTTFAVYQLERQNIAIPDDNGFTQQVGNQRSRGFEVDVAAQPSSSLRAFFSYAFNDAELTNFNELVPLGLDPLAFVVLDRSGHRPAFAPKHILNFWVSHDFPIRLGLGGGARYVSSQFIAEDNGFALDGILTFDAMVSYRIRDLRLRVNFKNLTNRKYFTRGFGSASVIPAAPFAVYFGFDYAI